MEFREYLSEGRKKQLTDKQIQMIKSELEDGMSSKSSIASRYGVSVGYINDVEKGNRRGDVKIELNTKKHKPLEKYSTKRDVQPGELTDQDVRDIRKAFDAGEKPVDLAKKYGVAYITIKDIGERKRRKNVI